MKRDLGAELRDTQRKYGIYKIDNYSNEVKTRFGHNNSPRIEELISYTSASRYTGIPMHQLQYLTKRNKLTAVPLPNGKTALLISEVQEIANNE